MKHRSLVTVGFLPFLTLGVYGIVWHVRTKGEIVQGGGHVPTAWLMILPVVNFYWLWKYYKAGAQITAGDIKAGRLFALVFSVNILNIAATIWETIRHATYTGLYDLVVDPIIPTLAIAASLVNLGAVLYLQAKYNKI